ncbi:MAG: hypothetical protein NTX50_20515 [Candidatus Sumerlaeota bacterium]|nr:hypothetical protein [Candidatus Sumerlaeota bacterium]
MRRCIGIISPGLALLCLLAVCSFAEDAKSSSATATPVYRVETDGFGASEADIKAVLNSASREMWQYFPDYKIEPIVVTRGRSGPITLHKRNDRGEIVMRLDTEKTSWCQYSYQFAHEFCHVLCGYKDGYQGNKWFEETLCETASMFAMRKMAKSWKKAAPYPNWKDYRDSLREYVDDIIRKREYAYEIYAKGLPEFYRAHKAALEKEPGSRDLNGAMALVFLQLFEEQPEQWEAVRWLNSAPASEGDTFAVYLQKWHNAVPKNRQPFVQKIAGLFGVSIKPT